MLRNVAGVLDLNEFFETTWTKENGHIWNMDCWEVCIG